MHEKYKSLKLHCLRVPMIVMICHQAGGGGGKKVNFQMGRGLIIEGALKEGGLIGLATRSSSEKC